MEDARRQIFTGGLGVPRELAASLFEDQQQEQAAINAPRELRNFEEQPIYASGQTPETAINKSPVDLTDRFRYSLGNEKGIEADLKLKFPEGVTKDAKGNFTIKKDGSWFRADAKGLGDGDPWERTQELIADAADIGPQLAKNIGIGATMGGQKGGRVGAVVGGAVGAATTMAGDAYSEEISQFVKDNPVKSAAAATILAAVGVKGLKAEGLKGVSKDALPAMIIGTGAEAARTSLGRLVGTYDATPWEQAGDVGLEALYNLGGSALAAGIKPTGASIVKAAKTMANGFRDAPETALTLAAAVHGPLSGVGADNIETIAKRPEAYKSLFADAMSGVKTNEEAIGNVIMKQTDDLKGMVNQIPKALSRQYVKMSEGAVNSVEKDFVGSTKMAVESTWQRAADLGIGRMQLKPSPQGYGGLPKIKGFRLNDDDQLAVAASRLLKAGRQDEADMVQGLIGNPDAKRYVMSFLKTISAHRQSPDETGVAGARALTGFKRAVNSRITDLRSKAAQEGISSARGILKTLDDHLDSFLVTKFAPKDPKAPNLFSQFNQAYSQMKSTMEPLLSVRDSAIKSGSDQPYLTLLNQVSSDTRSGTLKRQVFSRLVSATNPKTGEALFNNEIRDLHQRIIDREAVKATIPAIRMGVLGRYGPASAVAVGLTNPQAGMLGAGILAGTSPRLTGKMVMAEQAGAQWLKAKDASVRTLLENAAKQVGDTNAGRKIVDIGFKGLRLTQELATSGRAGELLKNEELMRSYAQTLLSGFTSTYTTQNKLMSQVPR